MIYVKLNNQKNIPAIGLGTYPITGLPLWKVVLQAMYHGYTLFDTASSYQNETWIGRAIQMSLKKREDLFLTTKLSNVSQRRGDVKGALINSMTRLRVKYVDLYLMHWPHPDHYLNTWKKMEILYKKGLVHSIGVCNFQINHLRKLLEIAEIKPCINQIEMHPLLTQKDLVEFCGKEEIVIEAYSPLAQMDKCLIENRSLCAIAHKYNKKVTQIVIRWGIQNGFVMIPRTSHNANLKENLDVFDFSLSKDEMQNINDQNINKRIRYHPDDIDYNK